MKSGSYCVSFNVDLTNCENEEEAVEAVREALTSVIDNGEFPEVVLELVEEFDIEYETDEDELEELCFDEVV